MTSSRLVGCISLNALESGVLVCISSLAEYAEVFDVRTNMLLVHEVVELENIKVATAKINKASCALHSLIAQKEFKFMWDK